MNALMTWQIDPQSLATDLEADALERKITASMEIPETQKSVLSEFVVLLVCTQSLEVDEKRAKAPLNAFKAMLAKKAKATPELLWQWRVSLPYGIVNEWRKAFNDAQSLWETDPAELPTDMLTAEQLDEASQPDSPLVPAGVLSLNGS